MRLTSGQNTIDPLTGLPVILGSVRVLQNGNIRVSQTTGEPPGGLNQEPGTDPVFPITLIERDTEEGEIRTTLDGKDRIIEENEIGLPYGFVDVPETGPLK